MILLQYYRSTPGVAISGHAESGAPGHDLVCAAASMLAYTLGEYVQSLEKRTGDVFAQYSPREGLDDEEELVDGPSEADKILELLPGMALIVRRERGEKAGRVRAVFDAVCNGFALLARQFPENAACRLIEGPFPYDEYFKKIGKEADNIDT